MPEYYPTIGDAFGAAMAHNIKLAHRGRPSVPDESVQVRDVPHPSADPYSVPGMIARLTETATPQEVAAILQEINGALAGALPQLTELVAAAADWTRVRLTLEEPHHELTTQTWTRLAAAHVLLGDVREQLQAAEDLVAVCPSELGDPQCLDHLPVMRTGEPLSGAVADATPPAPQSPEADRRRTAAATATSPNATPAAAPPPAANTSGPASKTAPATRRAR